MKILYIDPNNNTPQYCYPVYNRLRKKTDIVFYTSFNNFGTKFYDQFYKLPVHYFFFPFENRLQKRKIRKLAKAIIYPIYLSLLFFKIQKINPQIIHFNWLTLPFFDLFFILLCIKCHKKVILTQHNYIQHKKKTQSIFEKIILNNIDSIIVLSEFTYFQHPSKLHKKIRFIDHGNVYEDFIFNPNSSNNTRTTVAFVGGIKPYKGIFLLLESIGILIKEGYRDFQFIVKGYAEYKIQKEVERLIEFYNIKDYVDFDSRFMSNDELFRIVAESDIGILPYISATQSGLPYLFYSFNKPIIVSDVGALPKQGNDSIMIVSKADPQNMTDSIISCQKKILNNEFKKEDFNLYLKSVSLDITTNQILELYSCLQM